MIFTRTIFITMFLTGFLIGGVTEKEFVGQGYIKLKECLEKTLPIVLEKFNESKNEDFLIGIIYSYIEFWVRITFTVWLIGGYAGSFFPFLPFQFLSKLLPILSFLSMIDEFICYTGFSLNYPKLLLSGIFYIEDKIKELYA